MKSTFKVAGKYLLASLILTSGVAMAAPGTDETYKNMTLEERLYLFDGYGAKWGLDAGNDGLWFVPEHPIGDTYNAPFKVRNNTLENTLVVGSNEAGKEGNVGIGTDTPSAKLDVNGTMAGSFSGSDTANNHNIVALSSANDSANSDVGFSLENTQDGHNGSYKWAFRTYEPAEGLSMTKIGTGGTEFLIENLGDDLSTTKLYAAGTLIFENGHLVTSSSKSIKRDIKPLDTTAALEAFHKLQPVSYAYKADKDEPVVGFIAEDVPALVAMPSRKSFDSTEIVAVLTSVLAETRAELKAKDERIVAMEARQKAQDEKIANFEAMQKKVAQLESILTNLALDTSHIKKEKISVILK